MTSTTTQRAQQGHLYTYHQKTVLALESGPVVRVLEFNKDQPWLGNVLTVAVEKLVPQPMKYFHGEIPS